MAKVLKYFGEARQRAKRKSSSWNLILVFLTIIFLLILSYFLSKSVLSLQRFFLIPKDAIYSSPTNAAYGLIILPLMFSSIFMAMILSNIVGWSLPWVRKILNREAEGIENGAFKDSMKFLFKATAISMIFFPLVLLGFFNYFYVAPNGVTIRPLFSSNEKHYDWGDINRVYGEFWDSNNNFYRKYILNMKDGASIELVGGRLFEDNVAIFLGVYEKIKPFLKGQFQIDYDSSIKDTRINRSPYTENDLRFIEIIRNQD